MWIEYKKKLLQIINGIEAQREGKKGVATYGNDMHSGGVYKALFLMDEMELMDDED